jgi:hypothetical protein
MHSGRQLFDVNNEKRVGSYHSKRAAPEFLPLAPLSVNIQIVFHLVLAKKKRSSYEGNLTTKAI